MSGRSEDTPGTALPRSLTSRGSWTRNSNFRVFLGCG